MVRAIGIAAVAAVLFLAPACGSDKPDSTATTVGQDVTTSSTRAPTTSAPPSSSADAAPAPGQIDIVDFEFSPRELTVARGETVTWRNQDPYDHWVVSTQADVLDSGELSQAQA